MNHRRLLLRGATVIVFSVHPPNALAQSDVGSAVGAYALCAKAAALRLAKSTEPADIVASAAMGACLRERSTAVYSFSGTPSQAEAAFAPQEEQIRRALLYAILSARSK